MASTAWLDRADWKLRAPGFGALVECANGPAMEFAPPEHATSEEWRLLRDQWLALSKHPNVLEPIARGEHDQLLLRYAAIDWGWQPLVLSVTGACVTFARWGLQLTDALEESVFGKRPSQLCQLLRPFVMIDLCGGLRVGFLPVVMSDPTLVAELPPEVRKRRVAWKERTFVFVIGRMMQRLGTGLDLDAAAPARAIVEKCVDPSPRKRYRTLDALRAAWWQVIGRASLAESVRWDLAEEGIGWLALGNPRRALGLFDLALKFESHSTAAVLGKRRAREMIAIPEGGPGATIAPGAAAARVRAWHQSGWSMPAGCEWSEVHERAARLETERDFRGALALYLDVRLDGSNDAAIHTAIARCQLALDAAGIAVDYAQRALAANHSCTEAHAIRSRGYLLLRRPGDALAAADEWSAAFPGNGTACYARGRALFALGRFGDARDAFDRACTLEPTLLAAMLLRREADRAATHVRDVVGTQPALELAIPEHLSQIHDALVAGRIAVVIRILARPEHDTDPIAKLLQARCLAFERRFDDAIPIFERAAELSPEHAHEAELGKAHALLALGRADDALALFERALSRAPGDLEAIEGHALALRALGRDAEADDEQRRVTAASAARSDLRLGRAPY